MKRHHSVCPVFNPMFRNTPDMLTILYTQEPDGEVLEYQCYPNRHDRRCAYEYLIDSGYEIIGEA